MNSALDILSISVWIAFGYLFARTWINQVAPLRRGIKWSIRRKQCFLVPHAVSKTHLDEIWEQTVLDVYKHDKNSALRFGKVELADDRYYQYHCFYDGQRLLKVGIHENSRGVFIYINSTNEHLHLLFPLLIPIMRFFTVAPFWEYVLSTMSVLFFIWFLLYNPFGLPGYFRKHAISLIV